MLLGEGDRNGNGNRNGKKNSRSIESNTVRQDLDRGIGCIRSIAFSRRAELRADIISTLDSLESSEYGI